MSLNAPRDVMGAIGKVDSMKRTGRISVLIKVLATIERTKTSLNSLVEVTGYSRTAVVRLLKLARAELNVSYKHDRESGYVITDWGVLDRQAVLDSVDAREAKSIAAASQTKRGAICAAKF